MTQSYKDPHSYLNDAVVKRGKSGSYGVYLTNVTVVAEATCDYNYKVFSQIPQLDNPFPDWSFEDQLSEWYGGLVRLRSQKHQEDLTFHVGGRLYQFIPEGAFLSLNVYMPVAYVESFQYDVSHAQSLLQLVSDFCSKNSTSIRFNVGVAHKSWGDMTEEGEAQEVEFSF